MAEVVSSKVCTKCGEEKIIGDFRLDSYKKKDGTTVKYYEGKCKYCKKEDHKKWCEENKGRLAEQKRNYRRKDPEKNKRIQKEWREKNKDRVAEYNKKKPEERRLARKEKYEKNREFFLLKKKSYAKKYPERIRQRNIEWRKKNREHIKEYDRNYKEKNSDRIKVWKKLGDRRGMEELKDWYIINTLANKIGTNAKHVRQYPDLIESQRLIIKIHRLCKTSQI